MNKRCLFIAISLAVSVTCSHSQGGRARGLNNFNRIAPSQFKPSYFTYGQTDHAGASRGQDIKFQVSVKTKIFRD